MGYFGAASRMTGDPGFFDTLKNIAGRAVGAGVGFVTGGPGGAVRGALGSGFAGPSGMKSKGIPVIPSPGLKGAAQRFVPGGATGLMVQGPVRRRRRRINPTNVKALKRAMRRQDAFVKVAKNALKGSNYQIVTKSSRARRSRKDLGSGHTHVR